MDMFDMVGPLDFRYYGRNSQLFSKLKPYLSENAMVAHMAAVEVALVKVLAKRKICTPKIAKEVAEAAKSVTAEEVYTEEDRIKHNVRALVNMIRKRVSDEAKPFVHLTATSHDIICTADALRMKAVTNDVLLPMLKDLEKTLIEIALREKNTVQIGRTHGQHAEPITFGFTVASYVSRLGHCIQNISWTGNNLRGKLAGAVGAYNASSLFFDNPEQFEEEVLNELGLLAATHSTQIVEPEYMADYVHSIVSAFGVLANLADDMRHLQRTEIAEVGEFFDHKQVGSSTMPQKQNPINFENVKSLYKAMMPRMMTVYMDQISEHQRDLTNSASSRFTPEILVGFASAVERLTKTMGKMRVHTANMQRNFDMNKSLIAAEPAYILLAYYGHPDAHETVRKLTLKSRESKVPLEALLFHDAELKPYIAKLNSRQKEILKNPANYTGIAARKAAGVCTYWKKELKI